MDFYTENITVCVTIVFTECLHSVFMMLMMLQPHKIKLFRVFVKPAGHWRAYLTLF